MAPLHHHFQKIDVPAIITWTAHPRPEAKIVAGSGRRGLRVAGPPRRCRGAGERAAARWPLTARTAGGRLVHCTGDRADLGEYRDVKITDSNTWALFGTIE